VRVTPSCFHGLKLRGGHASEKSSTRSGRLGLEHGSSSSGSPQLRRHLADFVAAYNFARRLKTLKGLTPYELICKAGAEQPERFTLSPLQQMPGLNI